MRRNLNSRFKRASNLISAVVCTSILSIASLGLISSVISATRLDSLNRDKRVVFDLAQAEFNRLQFMTRAEFITEFDPAQTGANEFNQTLPIPSERILLPRLDTATGAELTHIGFYKILPPPGVPFAQADTYTVYIEFQWTNRALGDRSEKFQFIVSPPDSF